MAKKKKVGRPKTTVIQRLKKICFDLDKIEKLAMKGFTDVELSELLDIGETTLKRWKKDPEFMDVLKIGKSKADEMIEGSLFHRAKGYTTKETKVFNVDGQLRTIEIEKHFPPDTTSMIYWTKNRMPDRWGDLKKYDHTNKGEKFEGIDLNKIPTELLDKLKDYMDEDQQG